MMTFDDKNDWIAGPDIPRILLKTYGATGPFYRQLVAWAIDARLPELQKRGRFWFCHQDDLPKLAERVGVIAKVDAA